MIAIGIRHLNGWYMASDSADRNRPEWPPHPDRIFMALAAAHFETDGGRSEPGGAALAGTAGSTQHVGQRSHAPGHHDDLCPGQ